MSTDRIPMSKEGYEKLKAQLDKFKNEDMPRIAEQIAQARGYGDLSENAEFDAAVEAQGMLQARINELQNKLSQAYIVDKSNLSTERAAYGLKVRVLDLDFNEEEDFILVGPGEEDYDQNKILDHQPDRPGSRRQEGRRAGRGPDPSRRPQPEDRRDQPGPLRSRTGRPSSRRIGSIEPAIVSGTRCQPRHSVGERARRGASASAGSDAGSGAIGHGARWHAAARTRSSIRTRCRRGSASLERPPGRGADASGRSRARVAARRNPAGGLRRRPRATRVTACSRSRRSGFDHDGPTRSRWDGSTSRTRSPRPPRSRESGRPRRRIHARGLPARRSPSIP